MDAEQSAELTGTNRPCGLSISLRQTLKLAPRIRVASRDTVGRAPCERLPCDAFDPKVSGGDFEEATPDPIPNSEVKLFGADGTAREAVWESRTLPGLFRTGSDAFASGPFRFCPLSWAPRRIAVSLAAECAVDLRG